MRRVWYRFSESAVVMSFVVAIGDGDGGVVETNGFRRQFRLYGVDAPERGQPSWRESRDYLKQLILLRPVMLRIRDFDRYGRCVADVYGVSGIRISAVMIRAGMAWWYRQYAFDDFELREAEEAARRARGGLWVESSPTPPWVYRHEKNSRWVFCEQISDAAGDVAASDD